MRRCGRRAQLKHTPQNRCVGSTKLDDYVMDSDIFPTGYHATELAQVQPGDSAVIYDAGGRATNSQTESVKAQLAKPRIAHGWQLAATVTAASTTTNPARRAAVVEIDDW